MLPEFTVEIPEPHSKVRCRDIPAAVFFYGFPDDMPFTDCYRAADWSHQYAVARGMERWINLVLTRVAVEPALSLELVQRLGPSRDVLASGYLEVVGWIPRDPDRRAYIPVAIAPTSRKKAPPYDLAALASLPGRNLHGILKTMATRTRTLPATLWHLPISEWLFNLRALADPQATPDDAARFMGLDV